MGTRTGVRSRPGRDHFGRQCTGYVRGHDDLVDPTPAKVAISASLLANTLAVRRTDGGSRYCRNAEIFREHMTAAAETARQVDLHLERTRGRGYGATELQWCAEVATHIAAAHPHTVDDLHRRVDASLQDAHRLVRQSRAAWRRTCEAGQHRGVPCTQAPGRVRLRLTAPEQHGPIDTTVGCTWHVAEHWAAWTHRSGHLDLLGPSPVAGDVELLGRALTVTAADHGVSPEDLDLAARTAAAARAGLPELVDTTFVCPLCRAVDDSSRAVDEGWCAACDRHTGVWTTDRAVLI